MNKKWIIEDICNNNKIAEISPLIQTILHKRKIVNKKEIMMFLEGDLSDLHDPFLFNDMKRIVTRIEEAVEKKQKVLVFGDYDVDGITSTSLLYNYFRDNYGFKVDYYIPDRLKEGYGINMEAVKKIVSDYDLMITVDCGITACKEVAFAQKNGLDVIITDHHQPAEELPGAYAILSPCITEDNYPCEYLAGVGVAFKICQALNKEWEDYLDLVALGTVADIVPLKGENHILVKHGLQKIENTNNPGLSLLLRKLGLADKSLTAGQIGYILAPPINATGRIEDPQQAIQLLTTKRAKEAQPIAERLTKINKARQQQEEKIYKQAVEMVKKEVDFKSDRCIVLAGEDWHPGIIGIVASRLVDKYYLPVVLIALNDNEGRGSCRSLAGINIYRVLTNCSHLLTEFGGHAQAAGLTVARDKITVFREKFNDYLKENFDTNVFIPHVKLDAVLKEEDINRNLYDNINKLMPFGAGNPRPKFCLNNTQIKKCYTVGSRDKHLKFELANGLSGIGFNLGNLKNDINGNKVDLAFNIKLNKWRGKEKIQINLIDINIRRDVSTYPVNYNSSGLQIFDKRDCKDPAVYISSLIESKSRTAVYINNRKECREYSEKYEGRDVYFFSSTEALPEITIDQLVLISLPFSLNELATMLKLFAGKDIKLHLLYGRQAYYRGCKLIKSQLPTGSFLRKLYKKIKSNNYDSIISSYNKKLINSGLDILAELQLIDYNNDNIELLKGKENKLDFSKSIRYNEITDIIDKFNKFSQVAYANNLIKLIRMVKNNMQEVNNGF